jgi:hypothetical protein
MITKSGGNLFSGSLRDTYNDDNWRSYVTGNNAHPSNGLLGELLGVNAGMREARKALSVRITAASRTPL